MINQILDVRVEGFSEPVGNLISNERGAAIFYYDETYLSDPNALPISLALPLSAEPFSDQETRAYFDNLLPENDLLQQVREREGLAREDIVGLLYHLGSDCSGAISCVPVGDAPIKIPGNLASDYDALAEKDLAEIVRRLADREPLPSDLRDPSPIAGVQRKIAIVRLGENQFALPKPGLRVPTTHILKVPRRGRGREAYLEASAARLAAGCSLEAVSPDVLEVEGITALLITRFDRTTDESGGVFRIHQEDFAQALGLPSTLKYERYGRTASRCFNARAIAELLNRTREPALSRQRFLVATMFNLAIGNTDNHAKNHALFYDKGAIPRLGPLYDLLPVRLDDQVTHDLSFKIGDANHPDSITRLDFEAFMSRFGFSPGSIDRFLKETVAPLLSQLDELAKGLAKEGLKDFDDLIGREAGRMVEALNLGITLRSRDYYETRGGGWQTPS